MSFEREQCNELQSVMGSISDDHERNNQKNFTIPHNLEPLANQIKMFHESDGESYLLDYELTKKERNVVHLMIESLGLFTESVNLTGSANKKIRIYRNNPQKDVDSERPIESEDVEFFTNSIGSPHPCTDPNMVPYYNEVLNPMFETEEKWKLFLSERRMGLKKETVKVREKICSQIRDSSNYQKLLKIKLNGQSNRLRGDVYHFGSVGKTFISIDLRSANYSCLRLICPDIFTHSDGSLMSWLDFIRTKTKSEFIAQSKIFREIIFGKLGFTKCANVLQEAIMERVDQVLQEHDELKHVFNSQTLRVKCGDEIVYEILNEIVYEISNERRPRLKIEKLEEVLSSIKISEIPTFNDVFKKLGFDANVQLGQIFHVRIFTVTNIAAKAYFVKTFHYRSDWPDEITREMKYPILGQDPFARIRSVLPLYKRIEFKKVDKKFYLQVLKFYQRQPIDERDLIFTDSGVKAKFMHSIFE